ncbi:hypothetical protein Tco_1116809 [Tanacetum coccineum]
MCKRRKQSGEVKKETDEGTLDHPTVKLKGVEYVSSAAQFLLDMKKASKASRNEYILQPHPKGPGEGSSMILDIPDDQGDSSSSSHSGSDDEEGFLQTDDEELKEQYAMKEQKLIILIMMGRSNLKRSKFLYLSQSRRNLKYHLLVLVKHYPLHNMVTILNDIVLFLMDDILQDPVETETRSMVEVPIQ